MAKQKKPEPQPRPELSAIERLSLRVSGMINSPRAQERCSAAVRQLNTDTDEVWNEVMMMLGDTYGVSLTFQDDGDVLIEWERPTDEDRQLEVEELGAIDE